MTYYYTFSRSQVLSGIVIAGLLFMGGVEIGMFIK